MLKSFIKREMGYILPLLGLIITVFIIIGSISVDNILILILLYVIFPVLFLFPFIYRLYQIWREYFLTEFCSWSFIIISNLFYDYDFKTDPVFFKNQTKYLAIPRVFSHLLDASKLNIKILHKKFKIKAKKGRVIRYQLKILRCVHQKEKNLYFCIFIITFLKNSFIYLAKPPQIKNKDLYEMGLRLPFHYASKIPVQSNILQKIAIPSNSVMQYKDKMPLLFNYSRILTFEDHTEEYLSEIDEELRKHYKVQYFKELDGFSKYQPLFTSPIIRKSRDHFYNLYQNPDIPIQIPDRPAFVRFGFEIFRMNYDFFRWLSNQFYYLCDFYHIQIQDYKYLFQFLEFLDWCKGKIRILNYEESGELQRSLLDVLLNFKNDYEVEYQVYKIFKEAKLHLLQEEGVRDILNDRELHFKIHFVIIKELQKFIEFLDSFRNELALGVSRTDSKDIDLLVKIMDSIADVNSIYQKIFKTKEIFFKYSPKINAELLRDNFANKIGALAQLFETNIKPIQKQLHKFDPGWKTIKLIKEWFQQERIIYPSSMIKTWKNIISLRNKLSPFHHQGSEIYDYLNYFGISSLEDPAGNWIKVQKVFYDSLKEFLIILRPLIL